MKLLSSIICLVSNAVWMYCETGPGTASHFDADTIEECGDSFNTSLSRHPRSLTPYDSICQMTGTSFPNLEPCKDNLAQYPVDQPHPQSVPVIYDFDSAYLEGLSSETQLDLENSHVPAQQQCSLADPQGSPQFCTPEIFISDPETQLETPIFTQKQGKITIDLDKVSKILHKDEVFSDKTVQTSPAYIDPRIIFEHTVADFSLHDPGKIDEGQSYNAVKSLPEEQLHQQVLFTNSQEEPCLNTPLSCIDVSSYKPIAQSTSLGNTKRTAIDNENNINRIIVNSCSMAIKKLLGLKPSSDSIFTERSTDISWANDRSNIYSKESQMEENCDKTKIKPISCELKNKQTNKCVLGKSEVKRVVHQDNRDGVSELSSVLTGEQLNELKNALRKLALTNSLKNEDCVKNVKDTSTADGPSSIENSRCTSCKLSKCLHMAKLVGDYISENAQKALQGLGGLVNDDVKTCHINLGGTNHYH